VGAYAGDVYDAGGFPAEEALLGIEGYRFYSGITPHEGDTLPR
jgi:hypothetical protein